MIKLKRQSFDVACSSVVRFGDLSLLGIMHKIETFSTVLLGYQVFESSALFIGYTMRRRSVENL